MSTIDTHEQGQDAAGGTALVDVKLVEEQAGRELPA
jgi:hypothetical protein